MLEPISLLPQNATAWLTAQEMTDAARWQALDVDFIRRQKDALLCEVSILPLLAWERSVDLWYADWPVEKRRFVVDRWFDFERLKGTEPGFRRFFDLVGVGLERVTSPLQGAFAADNLTLAEYRRFLAAYPQLRTYPYVAHATGIDGIYLSVPGADPVSGQFAGDIYPEDTSAIARYRREARLYEPLTGEEIVLTRREVLTVDAFTGVAEVTEQIMLPARAIGFYAGDGFVAHDFVQVDDAPARLFSMQVARPYGAALGKEQFTPALPSLDPIRIDPELVAEGGVADAGLYAGDAAAGETFAAPDTAWQRLFERVFLFDRARSVASFGAADAGMFADDTRLGMPRRTAEMKVSVRGRRHELAFDDFCFGYVLDEPEAPLDRAFDAASAAKAGLDTILLDTLTVREAQFGTALRFGQGLRFGDLLETV